MRYFWPLASPTIWHGISFRLGVSESSGFVRIESSGSCIGRERWVGEEETGGKALHIALLFELGLKDQKGKGGKSDVDRIVYRAAMSLCSILVMMEWT